MSAAHQDVLEDAIRTNTETTVLSGTDTIANAAVTGAAGTQANPSGDGEKIHALAAPQEPWQSSCRLN